METVLSLIRSKGWVSTSAHSNPADIPERISDSLAYRVQHALRAYTPNDQKAVKVAAQHLPCQPKFRYGREAITQLNTGEALVSFLDEKGSTANGGAGQHPAATGQIGPITVGVKETSDCVARLIYGVYEKLVDRESAYEILSQKQELLEEERKQAAQEKERIRLQKEEQKAALEAERAKRAAARQRKADQGVLGDIITQVGRSTTRQITYQLGRTITRSLRVRFRQEISFIRSHMKKTKIVLFTLLLVLGCFVCTTTGKGDFSLSLSEFVQGVVLMKNGQEEPGDAQF